ncbi:hypothetical protein F183_A12820 [Bryobacterales bacterium F-183]|nr:hypothetical protein F183_A12820 [Bryobacterales bacterium F-183]
MLVAIVAAGLGSRMVHTGWIVFDKYLGDALYAAMVYVIVRMAWPARLALGIAAAIMVGLELFQLTGIPARLVMDERLGVRLFARLLGTTFGVSDLVAYAVGLLTIHKLHK